VQLARLQYNERGAKSRWFAKLARSEHSRSANAPCFLQLAHLLGERLIESV
jgi:hypothetical protein